MAEAMAAHHAELGSRDAAAARAAGAHEAEVADLLQELERTRTSGARCRSIGGRREHLSLLISPDSAYQLLHPLV